MTDLEKELQFSVLLDDMKRILRRTKHVGGGAYENDAEHSFHISTMAMVFHSYCKEETDLAQTIKMLLVHDLVEIYAGDTFCYDEQANLDKCDRENEAADKLFGMLPGEKGKMFYDLWREFEEMNTPESKFANAMDRMQPLLNNLENGGGTWKGNDVRYSSIVKRMEPVAEFSIEIWDYLNIKIKETFITLGKSLD